ncbi:MAG: ATP-binding protein, partial [Bacillota bacterium]
VIEDFKLPKDFAANPTEQVSLLQDIGTTVPAVKQEVCIQCGDCQLNCPAQAIAMDPYPVVDAMKCISCFCCAELCMEGAMEVPQGRIPEKFDQMFR